MKMSIIEEKKKIRKDILKKRDELSEKEKLLKSESIVENVLGLPE